MVEVARDGLQIANSTAKDRNKKTSTAKDRNKKTQKRHVHDFMH